MYPPVNDYFEDLCIAQSRRGRLRTGLLSIHGALAPMDSHNLGIVEKEGLSHMINAVAELEHLRTLEIEGGSDDDTSSVERAYRVALDGHGTAYVLRNESGDHVVTPDPQEVDRMQGLGYELDCTVQLGGEL